MWNTKKIITRNFLPGGVVTCFSLKGRWPRPCSTTCLRGRSVIGLKCRKITKVVGCSQDVSNDRNKI